MRSFHAWILVGAAACSSSHAVPGDAMPSDAMETDAPCPSLAPLEAMDVSFMFPLPATEAQASLLLKVDAEGEYGVLFSRALADALGPVGESPPDDEYTKLYVTTVRFDPCARAACEPELRLVVQVLRPLPTRLSSWCSTARCTCSTRSIEVALLRSRVTCACSKRWRLRRRATSSRHTQ
jgi:hypothetical protein